MKKLILLITFLIIFYPSPSQTPVGAWSDHLTYNKAKSLVVGSKDVFASTGSSVLVFNKEFEELRKLSRVNGLTETGISALGWSEENSTLIIGYTSTNIDIIRNNQISNIPDISKKYIPGGKEIHKIRTNGRYAYLACNFGIVVLDLVKKEIYDTWKPGNADETADVLDIAFGNGKIYAATGTGVFFGSLSDPGLAYFGNWASITSLPDPGGRYNAVLFAGNKLYVNHSVPNSTGDNVYAVDAIATHFSYEPGVFNRSFNPAPEGFLFASNSHVKYFNHEGDLLRIISSYNTQAGTDVAEAVADNNDIWIADNFSGLIRGKGMSDFILLNIPGPLADEAIHINSLNGKTIICAGGVDAAWNNLWQQMEVSIHTGNNWSSLSSASHFDAMRTLTDPSDNNHIFVSTWGSGLLEYRNNILVNNYTESNSPLQTIIPGRPYVRICGMAMDKNKNLWITQSEVPGTIKILKPDGNWIVNPVTIDVPTVGDIIITSRGHKWIVLPRGNGLFVLDDNETPEYPGDDRYQKFLVTDSENKVFSYITSIAEDLDGNIWVGTDQGPLIYYNPEKIFDTVVKAFRIKIPRNDGTGFADYLLGSEMITCIAIDGANRKWLGTFSSGAFLLSADGTVRLKHYNEINSPLFSNSVASIAVDNTSGDVWFATTKGVLSVRGDATVGNTSFRGVYAFPNPVREDFNGNITITGLMRDAWIKITDVSGNLVFETVSDGGQASWDLSTYNGQRVATGVYLVFCASSDGSQSCVTKVLVIR